ncbi:MAG: tetratricopeptide repeat protein [Planctomycetota bacterium]
MKYPLSEAERLYAQELAGADETKAALEHAREAVALSPDNLEAQELLGDLCMLDARWGEGIEIFESLLAQGRPMETKLAPFCKHAGVVALAQDKKDLALRYFRRAHELGLSESELSSGADVLKSAAGKEARAAIAATDEGDWVTAETHLIAAAELWPDLEDVHLAGRELYLKRGQVALDNRDWPAARAAFEASLGWDDEFLVARHLVGLVSMQQGDYSAAASAWHRLVDQAREERIALPDPVHLDLARALELGGKPDEARAVLQNYLDFEPGGPYVDLTRAALADLGGR